VRHRKPTEETVRFVGRLLKFDFDLVPGLLNLVRTARGERRNAKLSPEKQLKAASDALQQISEGALGYFQAVLFFAALGHRWAAGMLAEMALAATAAVEGVIASRPREPYKYVPLWQSPEDLAKNDAHTLRPDTPFAAVLNVFLKQRELPVLIRRHAKSFNNRKIKLAEAVRLGEGLGERAGRRRHPNPDKPLNRFVDRYLANVREDQNLARKLPLLNSKPGCRRWALRMLDLFEQNNGPAIKHRLFAPILKHGPPTDKGKRGAIRDAVQDALFRRYNQGLTGPQKPRVQYANAIDKDKRRRRVLRRSEKSPRRSRRKK
jgi:hypothetical protein